MSVTILVGSQWGDEGKGKIVDILSEKFDIVARYQGGANAGHTIQIGENQFVLHLVPSGILREGVMCVIGNGVVLDPKALIDEIDFLKSNNIDVTGRLIISRSAHLIMPYHKLMDTLNEEGEKKIGTTGRGIGPCYVDKFARKGIKVSDLLNENNFREKLETNLNEKNRLLKQLFNYEPLDFNKIFSDYKEYTLLLKDFVASSAAYLNRSIKDGKSVLLEGAQGALLDIDFGTYPFVTSSNPTSGGACTGTGIAPTNIDSVLGIVKAYTTRVGHGPFPTELDDETGDNLRKAGAEYGATTGRPRRCGWLDLYLLEYSCMLNGIKEIALTKLDVLSGFETLKVCIGYKIENNTLDEFPTDYYVMNKVSPIYKEFEGWKSDISNCRNVDELPEETKKYINYISDHCDFKIKWISVGPKRDQVIEL